MYAIEWVESKGREEKGGEESSSYRRWNSLPNQTRGNTQEVSRNSTKDDSFLTTVSLDNTTRTERSGFHFSLSDDKSNFLEITLDVSAWKRDMSNGNE